MSRPYSRLRQRCLARRCNCHARTCTRTRTRTRAPTRPHTHSPSLRNGHCGCWCGGFTHRLCQCLSLHQADPFNKVGRLPLSATAWSVGPSCIRKYYEYRGEPISHSCNPLFIIYTWSTTCMCYRTCVRWHRKLVCYIALEAGSIGCVRICVLACIHRYVHISMPANPPS